MRASRYDGRSGVRHGLHIRLHLVSTLLWGLGGGICTQLVVAADGRRVCRLRPPGGYMRRLLDPQREKKAAGNMGFTVPFVADRH